MCILLILLFNIIIIVVVVVVVVVLLVLFQATRPTSTDTYYKQTNKQENEKQKS